MGLRSIRCTYSAARAPRITFTRNFVFFIVSCVAEKFCREGVAAQGEKRVTRTRGTGFQLQVSQTSRYHLDDFKERIGSKNRVFSIDKLPDVGREVNWCYMRK